MDTYIHSTGVYGTHSGDGAGGEGVDPILVPEQVQEMRVQGGLEVAHFQWVVPSHREGREGEATYNRVFRMYGHNAEGPLSSLMIAEFTIVSMHTGR